VFFLHVVATHVSSDAELRAMIPRGDSQPPASRNSLSSRDNVRKLRPRGLESRSRERCNLYVTTAEVTKRGLYVAAKTSEPAETRRASLARSLGRALFSSVIIGRAVGKNARQPADRREKPRRVSSI